MRLCHGMRLGGLKQWATIKKSLRASLDDSRVRSPGYANLTNSVLMNNP
jgi:hypothetical protein